MNLTIENITDVAFEDLPYKAMTDHPSAPPQTSNNIDEVLGIRGSRYGEFRDNSSVAQQLKNICRTGSRWADMSCAQHESLDQICSKISRAVSGEPAYADNWLDIAGYARLVVKELERK